MPGEKPKALRVPEGIDRLLRDVIHERTGVYFEDARTEMLLDKVDITARELGCQSFLEYYYALKDGNREAWDRTWEALSVRETYFWREMAQVDALVQVLIPEWFNTHATPFRIWSAACATGEEPFSIAMALEEAGLGSHPIEIKASDASQGALDKATAAIYREKSFRALPPALRARYFVEVAEGWKLDSRISSRVKFLRANLSESADVSALARANTIFCRNVFIYFSRHAVRKTVATIASRIPSRGVLFVGASESLLKMTTDFELKEIGEAMAYVRL